MGSDWGGALADHMRRIAALRQVEMLLDWDRETQMPPKGAAQRAEQAAAVAEALHALESDPRLADWLAEAARGRRARPRSTCAEAARVHARATRVPAPLAAALARAAVEGQTAWAAAREASDFAGFAPVLARIVALKREEAACLAGGGGRYDALLDDFEPGATAAEVAAVFDRLRPGLVALRQRIAGSARRSGAARRQLPRRRAARARAPDRRRLRLRLGGGAARPRRASVLDRHRRRRADHHPRRRGRPVPVPARDDPRGRACGLRAGARPDARLPAGRRPRLDGGAREPVAAVREPLRPQPRLLRLAGAGDGGSLRPATSAPQAVYEAVNVVEPGFIRTDADEVHYNLHVMLRFDLERALIAGGLEVADLEAAWNERFLADFGQPVPDARRGVLQDVHWPAAAFGYFPTYTLGTIYAAELDAAMRRDLDLDAGLAAGDLAAGDRLAQRPHPPARAAAAGPTADRRGDRPRARRAGAGRLPRSEVRRALRPLTDRSAPRRDRPGADAERSTISDTRCSRR